jgi:hypothetical protein
MTSTSLTATARLQQNPDILASASGDETVMMSFSRNNYYGLDEVGSRIWALLAQPQTLDHLCTTLQQEYRVDAETCQREVTVFVQRLLDEGLVTVG